MNRVAAAALVVLSLWDPRRPPASLTTSGTAFCIDRPGPIAMLSGRQSQYDGRALADSTRIDARNAVWLDQGSTPVKVGGNGTCWSGGKIQGTFPDSTSWSTMHDTYGMLVYGSHFVIENIRIHNYGDGISIHSENAAHWTIRGSHFSFLRDDCIENDFMNSGLVEDSFLDGCYAGYSTRAFRRGPPRNRSENLVTIRNTLMRLQAMPTVYRGIAPGHARFFKLERASPSPRLALHDNIFRVDQYPTRGKPRDGMFFIPPSDRLASCSNNIIVWLAPGDFPEPLPSCYRLTRDKMVWDAAVAKWLVTHPSVSR